MGNTEESAFENNTSTEFVHNDSSKLKRKYEDDPIQTEKQAVKHWQVGEQCQALWHKDGQYNDATIEEITTDGEVSVRFKNYNNTSVTTLVLLKSPSTGPSSKNRK